MSKRTVPTCSRCHRISVLDPCRECCTPAELESYPLPPDTETWLEMNKRLWTESGPAKRSIGSKDAEVIHAWARAHPELIPDA